MTQDNGTYPSKLSGQAHPPTLHASYASLAHILGADQAHSRDSTVIHMLLDASPRLVHTVQCHACRTKINRMPARSDAVFSRRRRPPYALWNARPSARPFPLWKISPMFVSPQQAPPWEVANPQFTPASVNKRWRGSCERACTDRRHRSVKRLPAAIWLGKLSFRQAIRSLLYCSREANLIQTNGDVRHAPKCLQARHFSCPPPPTSTQLSIPQSLKRLASLPLSLCTFAKSTFLETR